MLTLLMTALMTTAVAQQSADVAAPAPEGCYGDARSPFPEQDVADVPLDAAPRVLFDGRCASDVTVEMTDADDVAVPFDLRATELSWSTSVVAQPLANLAPDTAYTVVFSSPQGALSELRFTTGSDPSDPRAAIEITDVFADGNCTERREASFFLQLDLAADRDGLVGFVATRRNDSSTWQPIETRNGRTDAWVMTDAELGDTEACVFITHIEDDGTLAAWLDICADTPEIGDCRRAGRRGCFGQPSRGAVPLEGLVFLPLVLLFRRRRDT